MKYIPLAIVTVLWGLSFIATKFVVGEISPLTAALFRFSIALLTLWFLPKQRKISLFNIHKILAGFWGITIYFAAENFALKLTSPTNAAMIVSTAPIWYVLFTQLVHKRRTRFIQYIASLIALIGVALVILNGRLFLKVNSLGDLIAFLAAFSWVFYTHHITKLDDHSSLTAIFEITFWGVLTLIPFSAFEYFYFKPILKFNFNSIFGLIYLGIFCSAIGYFLWNKSIQILGDRTTTNAVYIIPVITAVSESLIFKRIPTLLLISGIILVVIGLYVFEKYEERGEIHG
ncbi:DMT family transporter [Thermosipho atlanticus]|uniref:Permease of the drug/metabolite transporter (DMT) superfamily n=1 Tax=Thermosipho atlanticus DSM 15807 TaxID=1123380 RepID=A0A1M5TR45_9BACT|nr:DMT family transporter [Thermosipho atlanticus]SHH53130.1 Permease of the drug/metabolite transporter (DMT) superfamily [Thermosipho atlanticus DSM 15807]